MKQLHTLIAVTIACLACTSAWAIDDGDAEADSPDDSRYRVELLLFANSNPLDEAIEQWFPPRALPVPENLQTLMPALPESAVDPEELETDDNSPSADAASGLNANTIQKEPAVIEPFTELTDISPDFEQAADRMRRSRYYRVLKLTAWEQALPQGADPVAVVIRGGELFGQHHELEGTISLRRERYLHAHARLWLSRFTEYTGESNEGDWPALPLLPTPPEREIASEANEEENSAEPNNDTPEKTVTETPQDDSDMAMNAIVNEGTAEDSMPYDVMPYDEWAEYDWFAPARPDRIVLLDQSRRLRSNELHYIDHPLLGVILRIVPIETSGAKRAPE